MAPPERTLLGETGHVAPHGDFRNAPEARHEIVDRRHAGLVEEGENPCLTLSFDHY